MSDTVFNSGYVASKTFVKFHRDGQNISCMSIDSKTGEVLAEGKNYVRCVMGPVGSGKTVGCVNEILYQAITQFKNPVDNTRRSSIAIVRDTYKNLMNTTIKTFLQWFPEGIMSKVKWTPPITIKWDFDIADNDHVHCEFLCVALDSPNAMEDLKSIEFSGAFVNECVAIDQDVINMLIQRVGRYPGGSLDPDKKTRSYIIMDTNPPSYGNWFQIYKDEIKPKGWTFYDQPPAMFAEKDPATNKYKFTPNVGQRPGIPRAENIEHLNEGFGYYAKTAETADPMYTLVYSCMKYGEVGNGTAVYMTYSDEVHCAKAPIPFNPRIPLILGFDYGLTPACVFAQYTAHGQLCVIDELFVKGVGVAQFIDNYVMPKLINKYRFLDGINLIAVGDPAGDFRKDTDEGTCMDILHTHNIPVVSCITNAILPRLESVRYFLNLNVNNGEPAFKISPNCEMLRKGFQGNYKFELVRGDSKRLKEEPCKNDYSHAHDALQYIAHRIRFAGEYGGGLFMSQSETKRREDVLSTLGRVSSII